MQFEFLLLTQELCVSNDRLKSETNKDQKIDLFF